ncbi:MAG: hypothetical protein V3U84_00840 [Thiotrichaceae bacterium]
MLEPLLPMWLAEFLGMSVFLFLILLATALFLATGIAFVLSFGTRKMFIFSVIPIMLGTFFGWFPVYFLFVSIIIANIISFINIPQKLTYKDKVLAIETELLVKHLSKDD